MRVGEGSRERAVRRYMSDIKVRSCEKVCLCMECFNGPVCIRNQGAEEKLSCVFKLNCIFYMQVPAVWDSVWWCGGWTWAAVNTFSPWYQYFWKARKNIIKPCSFQFSHPMGKISWKVKVSHPCVSAPKFRGFCHLGSIRWGLHLCPPCPKPVWLTKMSWAELATEGKF